MLPPMASRPRTAVPLTASAARQAVSFTSHNSAGPRTSALAAWPAVYTTTAPVIGSHGLVHITQSLLDGLGQEPGRFYITVLIDGTSHGVASVESSRQHSLHGGGYDIFLPKDMGGATLEGMSHRGFKRVGEGALCLLLTRDSCSRLTEQEILARRWRDPPGPQLHSSTPTAHQGPVQPSSALFGQQPDVAHGPPPCHASTPSNLHHNCSGLQSSLTSPPKHGFAEQTLPAAMQQRPVQALPLPHTATSNSPHLSPPCPQASPSPLPVSTEVGSKRHTSDQGTPHHNTRGSQQRAPGMRSPHPQGQLLTAVRRPTTLASDAPAMGGSHHVNAAAHSYPPLPIKGRPRHDALQAAADAAPAKDSNDKTLYVPSADGTGRVNDVGHPPGFLMKMGPKQTDTRMYRSARGALAMCLQDAVGLWGVPSNEVSDNVRRLRKLGGTGQPWEVRCWSAHHNIGALGDNPPLVYFARVEVVMELLTHLVNNASTKSTLKLPAMLVFLQELRELVATETRMGRIFLPSSSGPGAPALGVNLSRRSEAEVPGESASGCDLLHGCNGTAVPAATEGRGTSPFEAATFLTPPLKGALRALHFSPAASGEIAAGNWGAAGIAPNPWQVQGMAAVLPLDGAAGNSAWPFGASAQPGLPHHITAGSSAVVASALSNSLGGMGFPTSGPVFEHGAQASQFFTAAVRAGSPWVSAQQHDQLHTPRSAAKSSHTGSAAVRSSVRGALQPGKHPLQALEDSAESLQAAAAPSYARRLEGSNAARNRAQLTAVVRAGVAGSAHLNQLNGGANEPEDPALEPHLPHGNESTGDFSSLHYHASGAGAGFLPPGSTATSFLPGMASSHAGAPSATQPAASTAYPPNHPIPAYMLPATHPDDCADFKLQTMEQASQLVVEYAAAGSERGERILRRVRGLTNTEVSVFLLNEYGGLCDAYMDGNKDGMLGIIEDLVDRM